MILIILIMEYPYYPFHQYSNPYISIISMKYTFKPKSALEKFGLKVYSALVENFPRTYFAGGTVRDFLLGKKIKDMDITTEAAPPQTVETLTKYFINADIGFQKMGVIIATDDLHAAAIATLRRDLKSNSRYPKIKFVKTARSDAKRRDFTVNALYFSPKTGKILDFFDSLKDLKNKKIRFIGRPEKSIKEDPLRIIRALRFALQLNFKLEKLDKLAIKKHFYLVKQLTTSKTQKEIQKLKSKKQRDIIKKVLADSKLLDKYF